jgi:hypothetical protein
MNCLKRGLNRRQFLQRSLLNVGLYGATAAALAQSAQAEQGSTAGAGGNPFAYDVERLSRIDPRLVKYEQVGRAFETTAEPRRVAFGPGDLLHIATRDGIDLVDTEGSKRGTIPLGSPARCVAVAEDGTVYVGLRTHIEIFSAKGQSLGSWETPTRKTWFTGLSAGPNDVFAADSANRVIFRYDRSGKILGRIGEKSKERSVPGLIVPSPYLDVKLGRDNLLRVNNPGRHRVDVFTVEGDLEFSWGKPSASIEGFCGCCNPVGIAMLPDGRCITCEKGIPRVKIYSTAHVFESVVAGTEQFPQNSRAGQVSDRPDGTLGGLDAAVDSQGRIYVLDLVSAEVRVMRPKA